MSDEPSYDHKQYAFLHVSLPLWHKTRFYLSKLIFLPFSPTTPIHYTWSQPPSLACDVVPCQGDSGTVKRPHKKANCVSVTWCRGGLQMNYSERHQTRCLLAPVQCLPFLKYIALRGLANPNHPLSLQLDGRLLQEVLPANYLFFFPAHFGVGRLR